MVQQQKGLSPFARAMMRFMTGMHRWLYRRTRGRLGSDWANDRMPVLLLTTTGRRSGQQRTWPVGYMRDGEDYVSVASNGGQPQHPAWYLNLAADPRVTVELGADRRECVAVIARDAERERLWARIIADFPNFATYQAGTARQLPVVVLRPVPADDGSRTAAGR